jgi:heat shock protein HslJ
VTASYDLRGDSLTFGPMAGTLMACPQGMETEKAFFESLGRVKHWKIVEQRLELLDAARKVLARFEAVETK